MKILFADDHTLFRDALSNFICLAEPDSTVLQARDIHGVMELLADEPELDLIILDLHMPGMNGLQGLAQVRQRYPAIPVALMSGLAGKEDIEHAVSMGIAGYFPKTMTGKTMAAAIKQIVAGEKFFATNFNTGEYLPSNYGAPEKEEAAPALAATDGQAVRLTPREREVLDYLQRGESNKEIARSLDLQVVTVKLHVRGICRKLGAKNRTQAALLAQARGI